MTYQIRQNAGPNNTSNQYAKLSRAARDAVAGAHDVLWQYVTQAPAPHELTGYLVGDGAVFDDPKPKMDYVAGIVGAWIWSSSVAYMRFRIIRTKSKFDTWEYGEGPIPNGILLAPVEPLGRLTLSKVAGTVSPSMRS